MPSNKAYVVPGWIKFVEFLTDEWDISKLTWKTSCNNDALLKMYRLSENLKENNNE